MIGLFLSFSTHLFYRVGGWIVKLSSPLEEDWEGQVVEKDEKRNSQVFFILNRAEEKLFNFWMEGLQPPFLFSVGEVDGCISSW